MKDREDLTRRDDIGGVVAAEQEVVVHVLSFLITAEDLCAVSMVHIRPPARS
jgi:hypothetical protein